MTNWTEEQRMAINQSGTNIIVSAGAGSGKTTVLTERVITKLKTGIKLNELLILTFTNNSAQDMRAKIKEAIELDSNLEDDDNNVDNSLIMTFDAYVLSLVKKYHQYLNIDKEINIIDSSIINLKKRETLDDILNKKYIENDKVFIKLVTDLCAKNDSEFKRLLLRMDSNLDLIIKKEKYLNEYLNNYYSKDNVEELFNEYFHIIKSKTKSLENSLNSLSYEVSSDYYDTISGLITPLINCETYEDFYKIKSINIPSVPRGSSDNVKTLKAELKVTVDEIIELTNEDMNDLIKEVLNTKDYSKVIVDILTNLNHEIDIYKKTHNCFEFNDISRLAIKLLEDNPSVLNDLKYSFKEIMIDEYQDTSDMQETFISLIENNNVYMVGDIKQSIYRFRNANPSIFKDKYDAYKQNINGKKIDLNKNFRSRSEVVNSINEIFNEVMDDNIGSADYLKDHQMVFGNQNYNIDSPSNYKTEIYNYENDGNYSNDEIEAFIIAKDIKNKIDNKFQVLNKKVLRDCNYLDFCILMDRTSAFDTYKKVFDYMKIPINIYKDNDILLNDETILIKNILTFILKIKNREFDADFRFCFVSIARSYLFEVCDENIFLNITENTIYESEIFKIANEIAQNIDYMSNKEIIEVIIFNFDFYNKMIKVGNVNDRNIVLNNIITKSDELNKVGIDVYGLDSYLASLIENNNEIRVPALLTDKDAVVITNIHKSKGLEYHVCYFSGLYKKFNLRDSFDKIIFSKEYGIIIPNTDNGIKNSFIYNLYKERYILDEISEKIRLFYVSLTRCKEKMIMLSSFNENKINLNGNNIDFLTKIKYRSFLDIISSVYNTIDKYIVDVNDYEVPRDYLSSRSKEFNIPPNNEDVQVNEIEINNEILTKKVFSKNNREIITSEEKNNIDLGNKIHYVLETIDFINPNFEGLNEFEKSIINSFLKSDLLKNIKYANIIKEYEFRDVYECNNYSGIIDLILEYDTHIDIIDYKLKHTNDEGYTKQLKGYKSYIERKSNKKTNIYLYSLLDKKLIKID